MDRQDVYKVIDSEREYQDKKWGGGIHDEGHSLGDYLLFMEHHLNKAKALWSSENAKNAVHELRKATALGVSFMEINGCPKRD